ncbi:MAG: signal peptidase I [Clostridia bacterium]
MEDNTENTQPTETTIEPKKKKKSVKREILEWALCLLGAVAIALCIRTFLFEFVRVDGRSMAETLQHDERMFVTKLDYLTGAPDRFDVIICHYPDRGNQDFVKRIVGLPGDTIAVAGGKLFVNGVAQEEPYITYHPDYLMAPFTVPEGKYFVLGDNRSNSNDSHIIGPITRDQVVGHVRSVIWPIGEMRGIS